jgi:hypothetical protein
MLWFLGDETGDTSRAIGECIILPCFIPELDIEERKARGSTKGEDWGWQLKLSLVETRLTAKQLRWGGNEIGDGGFGNWNHNSSKEREIRDISNSKGELLRGGRKGEERPRNWYVMQTSSKSQDEGELIVVPRLDLIAIADDELDTSGDDNIVSKDRRWWWWSRVC